MNCNIIGFAGRLGSGKTELANICETYGYKKLYFALPLKQLCSKILNVTIDELNTLKRNNTIIDLVINEEHIETIHKDTKIPYDVIKNLLGGQTIINVRNLLQILGTDVIRQYNFNWHVEKLKEMMNDTDKYVIDDVRFPNEKEMIESLGGTCWFVIRPSMNIISNHISEIALEWRDFDNIIVNDKTLTYLKYHWECFMSNGYDKLLKIKQKIYQNIIGNDEINLQIKELNKMCENQSFTLQDALFIHNDEFNYTPKYVNNPNIQSVEYGQNNEYMTVKYTDNTYEIVKNVFSMEDLKKYL